MKKIKLTQGKETLVDDSDFEFLSQFKWHYNARYAVGKFKGKRVYLHKFLLNPPNGVFLDHINGYRLDNRRSNLRPCSNRQNQQNRGRPSNNTSGYKGVTLHRKTGKWQAQIMVDSKQLYLGLFDSLREAKRIHIEATRKYHKEFAHL